MFKNVLSFPCCNLSLHSTNTTCLQMPVDSPLTIFVIIYLKHITCLSNILYFSRSKVLTVVLLRILVCWHVTLVVEWMVPNVLNEHCASSRDKQTVFFKTTGTTHLITWYYISENLNPHPGWCTWEYGYCVISYTT